MSTQHIPIGPALVYEYGERQPTLFPLVDSAGVDLDIDDDLVFLVAASGSLGAASYELALDKVEPGLWSGTPELTLTPGVYEYRVRNVDAERSYVRGTLTVRAAPA